MQVPLLIAIVLLLSANPASAAPNCSTKVCVKVYTDPKTGKLIITAKQNGSSTAPKPIPTRTWKPRPYTPKPSPVAKPVVRPSTTVIVKKKYTPKPVVKLSLSDQLAQLIPIKEIHHQPATSALVQVPVNFWTTTPPNFKTSVVMLGVPITVYLSPTYLWDFGDGTTSTRSHPTKFYSKPGKYSVTLTIQSTYRNCSASISTMEFRG